MAGRRLLYLAVLEGCLVFFVAYREWFSWLALVAVLCLPWFSLLLSLPAMLSAKIRLQCPGQLQAGTPVQPALSIQCFLPAPPVRCRLSVRHSITGQRETYKPGQTVPTDHCGILEIGLKRIWVYDYLGLLRLPRRVKNTHNLAVLPHPVEIPKPPSLERYLAGAWRPKHGGGFAENHDLRLYRPGDDLRQIHWKLAAKTGKLIFREPIEPMRSKVLLTMTLSGDPDTVDTKMGKLLWMSQYLLGNGQHHEVRCLTGRGTECYTVTDETSLLHGLRSLLGAPNTRNDSLPEATDAAWQYRIGGGDDEA